MNDPPMCLRNFSMSNVVGHSHSQLPGSNARLPTSAGRPATSSGRTSTEHTFALDDGSAVLRLWSSARSTRSHPTFHEKENIVGALEVRAGRLDSVHEIIATVHICFYRHLIILPRIAYLLLLDKFMDSWDGLTDSFTGYRTRHLRLSTRGRLHLPGRAPVLVLSPTGPFAPHVGRKQDAAFHVRWRT